MELRADIVGVAKGVIKLFNAVRAAQIKGDEASRQVKKKGVVGMANREEKGKAFESFGLPLCRHKLTPLLNIVTEMSKQGFLSLIQAGGKSK